MKKFLGASHEVPKEMEKFFQAISDSYEQNDRDRALLDRSMELSSKELYDTNQKLKETLKEVEGANMRIMESIQYAERIQHSLLPSGQTINRHLENFIIWEPRDIVGGDIYFFEKFDDGYLIAVIDCTGHGVPGAFMTMVAGTALKTAVRDYSHNDPAKILGIVSSNVQSSLNQQAEGSTSDDGLDAGVCFVSPATGTVTFAGARLPLYYIMNNEIHVVNGDKQSLGYRRSDPNFSFVNHQLPLQAGSSYYLTTDGLIDQPGGERLFSFGKKRFYEIIKKNHTRPLDEQKDILFKALLKYQAGESRRDDITVVGFSFGRNGLTS